MRIKVPIEMLNEAASSLNKMESTLGQDSSQLIKSWNSLPLESRSKQAIDVKISQARSLAGRLSSQANSLGNYLNLSGMRFVEADRQCSEGGLKGAFSSMPAEGKGVLHSGIIDDRAKYDQFNEEYKKLNIYEDKNPELVSTAQMSWIGRILNAYANTNLPYSGVRRTSINVADNIYYDSDLYTTVGDLAVDVSKIAVGLAAGAAITGAAVAALPALPVVATGIVVGAGVSLAVSTASKISIGNKTVDRWLKDGTAYNLKTLRNNPSLILAGPVAPAITSFNYISKETVGIDIISGAGNMVEGLTNKIFNR